MSIVGFVTIKCKKTQEQNWNKILLLTHKGFIHKESYKI